MRGLFSEFYGTSFRKSVHSHLLMDVCFNMLNIVLTSPLSHWHNNNNYCIMIVSGDLLPHISLACCFRNKKMFNHYLFLWL